MTAAPTGADGIDPEGPPEPRPPRPGLATALREVADRRELLYMISWREIRIRYKQSLMGVAWAMLMPLIIVGAAILVRAAAAKVSGAELDRTALADVTTRALPWAFFVSALKFGTASLVGNANLVAKIALPKLVFPLSAILASGVDLAVGSVLLAVVLPVAGAPLTAAWLWLPVLLALLVLFTVGLTALLSAANLFFRDVKYLIEVILTFAIFFTPVLYPADAVGRFRPFLLLNPVAPILEGFSRVLVAGQAPELGWLAWSALAAGSTFVLGIVFFRRVEPLFAETV